MLDFLVVMFLFSPSVAGLSQATAIGEFVKCFPGWAEADQVQVSCNNTLIAQYCDPGRQSCRNITKPGVLLKKGSNGVRLTITNCSYDSWSCKPKGYIDGYEQAPDTFTVHVCNQQTSSSPNPVSTSTSPNPVSTSSSPNPVSTSTSPSPGNIESQSGTNAVWVTVLKCCLFFSVPIICLVIFLILYKKVKCFKKAICGFFSRLQRNNRTPNQEPDIEKGENKNFL